ncbi:saccharopine dehydrogenase family protein [Shimazuella alba]|uniref:Saccharopine dehydrogenase n=1 Tax=Shimazuella alba TaxID=2690964 RepID=A0A6I4VNC5_9BACL|nr:saccharopine dehydrogenase NADP-binding domain-containing protein [Shimazuella alba]MXQ52533.1 Saccharopine dehydrogenase [Shimazuella alba]
MKEKIIVVGGYGQVGKVICEELGQIYPYKVYAAGRNFQKAEQFSIHTEGRVLPLQLDVNEPIEDDFFLDVSMVVMCLDLQNTDFVQACVKHHVDYIDVTADYSVMSKIQQIHPKASTVVLSVGLAPGITNMLVKQGKNQLDQVDTADIYILLGLGESHGRAAIEWTVDNLSAVYSVIEQGSKKQVTSFSDGKKIDFPAGLGRKTAYRFNFSDQHVLPQTLGIPSASTRLCFDSEMMTNAIASLKRTGIVRWLQQPWIREKVINLFEKSQWGSEIYVAKVEVAGRLNGRHVQYQGSVSGEKEFVATGKVAAYVAKNVYAGQYSLGVFHMEQLFQPTDLFADLSNMITFNEKILGE